MEIVALLRGELSGLTEYISLLRSTYWPHKARQTDGKGGTEVINAFSRLHVAPIIPVSIIFPEKSLKFILGMLKPEGNNFDHIFDHSIKGKFLKNQIKSALNLQDLPESWEKFDNPVTDFLKLQHVTPHIIGIKKDVIDEKDGVEML